MQHEVIHSDIDRARGETPKEDTKIDKRLAAMEVYRWTNRTYITALGGIILVLVLFGALLYAGEGFAFIIASAAVAFFAWQFGIAARYRNYLKERYGL